MKPLLLLFCGSLLSAGCAGQANQNPPDPLSANKASAPIAATPSPSPVPNDPDPSTEPGKGDMPDGFRAVDFKSLTYPTRLRGQVALKDGEKVYENPEGGGDTFELRDVQFVDITGDGQPEAIAELLVVSCGVSCDGGSHLFYFFAAAGKRPRLLTRLETGSYADRGCALKSFNLDHRSLTLELFRNCRYRGTRFQSLGVSDGSGGKFEAHQSTRFEFVFSGRQFALRHRTVLPFAAGEIKNYEPTIKVGRS